MLSCSQEAFSNPSIYFLYIYIYFFVCGYDLVQNCVCAVDEVNTNRVKSETCVKCSSFHCVFFPTICALICCCSLSHWFFLALHSDKLYLLVWSTLVVIKFYPGSRIRSLITMDSHRRIDLLTYDMRVWDYIFNVIKRSD